MSQSVGSLDTFSCWVRVLKEFNDPSFVAMLGCGNNDYMHARWYVGSRGARDVHVV